MINRTPLPEPFLKRIRDTFSEAGYDAFTHSMNKHPVSSVRINPRKISGDSFSTETVPWCKYGFYLSQKPFFTKDPLFHAGAYYPQEASSMILWHILETLIPDKTRESLNVLDLCGAPGGKATLLASYLDGNGLLVTNEVIHSRAGILRENMLKWGAPNVVVSRSDPYEFSSLPGLFDIMIVDAPCSGEGMFRKGDTARREWSEENAAMCAVRQRRILKDAWPALREGGWLIYSTCTFNPRENEENLNWLTVENNAQIIRLKVPEEWGITEIPLKNGNGLAFYPHKVKGEGFFIAAAQKITSQKTTKLPKTKIKTPTVDSVIKKILKSPERYSFLADNELWRAFPKEKENILKLLKIKLNVIDYGIPIGTSGRKNLIPDPALAFSWEFNHIFPLLDLDKEAVLHYLKGETPKADNRLSRGYMTVTYNHIPLGFVKNVGNRLNNLFPKGWRIRMDI